jgi:outer membrane lipoprotein-sorting protein
MRIASSVAAILLAGTVSGAELEPPPADLDARQVAQRAEDTLRSAATYLEATLTIVSPRLPGPQVIVFRSWDDRAHQRAYLRVLAPPADAGTGFLRLHPNLWMYLARLGHTQRIPLSRMLRPWMGSDFSNDDLLHESSEIDDYDHELLGVDPRPGAADGLRAYVVEYRPHEEAPVAWGRIVAWIEVENGTPLRKDFFDASGERLRELRFEDLREVQSRYYPHRWTLTRLDKQGRQTRIQVDEIRFDQSFDESIFTTRQLQGRE